MFRTKCIAAGDFYLLRLHSLLLVDIIDKVALANVLDLFDDLLSELCFDYILWNHQISLFIVFFVIRMNRLSSFRFVFV